LIYLRRRKIRAGGDMNQSTAHGPPAGRQDWPRPTGLRPAKSAPHPKKAAAQ